jgi:hypothetical protein
MTASTCRTSFAIWIVLTQSSTVIMPRRPMIIFDETVVRGTVLLQIPFLKSTTSISEKHDAFALPQNNREPGRTQQFKNGSYNRSRILTLRPSRPGLPLSVGLGRANRPDLPIRAVSRVESTRGSGDLFDGLPVDIAGWFEPARGTGRIVSRSPGCPAHARRPNVRSFGSLDRARCNPIHFFLERS